MNFRKRYSQITEEYGYIAGILQFLWILIHKVLERLAISFFKQCLPVNNHLIILRSTPDYADNARALADYLVENGYANNNKIYFDVESPEIYKKKYPGSSITFLTFMQKNGTYKLSHLKLMYTAGYLMSTHTMVLNCYQGRKEQHFVRLWHGCGYKDRSSKDGHNKRNFDMALVPGPLFIKTKAYFWNVDEKYILAKGYPRYDWLLKQDEKAFSLIQRYKLNSATRVVMWMPTFRVDKKGRYNETKNLINFPILGNDEDWLRVDKHCKEHNVILLIKLHPFQKEYAIPFEKFSNIKEIADSVFESQDVQMYSFLALTDALISDYSSVAIDYLLVNKPIGFTLDDFNEYKDSRGFIFDNPLDYMPGHHLYTVEHLMQFLSDVAEGKDSFIEDRKRVRGIAITPSNHYCKDLLDVLGISK